LRGRFYFKDVEEDLLRAKRNFQKQSLSFRNKAEWFIFESLERSQTGSSTSTGLMGSLSNIPSVSLDPSSIFVGYDAKKVVNPG